MGSNDQNTHPRRDGAGPVTADIVEGSGPHADDCFLRSGTFGQAVVSELLKSHSLAVKPCPALDFGLAIVGGAGWTQREVVLCLASALTSDPGLAHLLETDPEALVRLLCESR